MALAQTQIQAQQQTLVFRHILAAVDFSPASKKALSEALALAASNEAHLSVVHVLQPDWRYEMLETPPAIDLERIDVRRRLQNFIETPYSGQKIESVHVEHGPIAPAIISVASGTTPDVIVVGTHGRGGISKFALGSVAEELLRMAPCPVITVGPKANHEMLKPESALCTILFATDFGAGSAQALSLAMKLAKAHGAKLVLVHLIPPMPATSASLSAYAPATAAADELQEWEVACKKRALRQLKECLPAGSDLEREPEYVVATDFFAEGVLTAAAKFNVDLIVMGTNRTGAARLAAHMPWTAVHEVLANAPCPVLTVAK